MLKLFHHVKSDLPLLSSLFTSKAFIKEINFSPPLVRWITSTSSSSRQLAKLRPTRKDQGVSENAVFDKASKSEERPQPLHPQQQQQHGDGDANVTVKEKTVERMLDLNSMSDYSSIEPKFQFKQLPHYYSRLAKKNLTGLVVLTAMGGYALAPGSMELSTLAFTAIGTAMTSGAANTLNQFLEVPYDSQMNRTKDRVLVRGLLSTPHAFVFAVASGGAGVLLLSLAVNPIVGLLGLSNLILYSFVYTPLKRLSILNTWVGSLVGAVPPLMGWVACTGSLDPGALVLAALLYSWQFPHFNALSWNLRPDYSRAGYRMMCVTDPAICKRTTLRHAVALVGICSGAAPMLGLTTWTFAVDSLPLNAVMVYLAWRFYREGDSQSSRRLFRFSLIYLPIVMLLMFLSRKQLYESKKE